jgi:hypothetical protein
MSPSFHLSDGTTTKSDIYGVTITAQAETAPAALVITITNGSEPIEIERAGLIFLAAVLPQDPPVLAGDFETQLGLPRTLRADETVTVRLDLASFQSRSEDLSMSLPRGGGGRFVDVVQGISLIDADDNMHWYSVKGVEEFIRAHFPPPQPQSSPSGE